MSDTITIADTPTDDLITYYHNLTYAPQGSKAAAQSVRIKKAAIRLTLAERGIDVDALKEAS